MGSELFICELTNFEFLGNEAHHEPGSSWYRVLKLNLPWSEVVVHPIKNDSEIIKSLKDKKAVGVTCLAIVRPNNLLGLEEFIPKLDDLCKMFSLAGGTKVNWITIREMTSSFEVNKIHLKSTVNRPFSKFRLIPANNPISMKTFIENSYEKYLRLKTEYNLDLAVEMFLETRNEIAYLESRALSIVVLLDMLQSQYAAKAKTDTIIEDAGFLKKISIVLEDFLGTQSTIPDELKSEVMQKLPELNRKSYLNLMKLWLKSLNIQCDDHELRRIRNSRNSLAHSFKFTSTDSNEKIREYMRMASLLNKVLIRLLGYEGKAYGFDLADLKIIEVQV